MKTLAGLAADPWGLGGDEKRLCAPATLGFSNIIRPMDKLAYLATFISLILGLAVANVLRHVGSLLKRGASADWYWIHTSWTVGLFLALAGEWWLLLQWERVGSITFFAYLTMLIKPSILFVGSELLFPDTADKGTVDLRVHFFQVRRRLFLVMLLVPFADVLDTLLKGWQHFRDLGWFYPVSMLGALGVAIVGAWTANERVQGVLVVLIIVVMLLGIVNALAIV